MKLFQHCLNYYFDLFPYLCCGSEQEDISPTSRALLLLKFKHLEIWISLLKNLSRHRCLRQLALVHYVPVHFSWDSEAWPAPINAVGVADCWYWVCCAKGAVLQILPPYWAPSCCPHKVRRVTILEKIEGSLSSFQARTGGTDWDSFHHSTSCSLLPVELVYVFHFMLA